MVMVPVETNSPPSESVLVHERKAGGFPQSSHWLLCRLRFWFARPRERVVGLRLPFDDAFCFADMPFFRVQSDGTGPGKLAALGIGLFPIEVPDRSLFLMDNHLAGRTQGVVPSQDHPFAAWVPTHNPLGVVKDLAVFVSAIGLEPQDDGRTAINTGTIRMAGRDAGTFRDVYTKVSASQR